MSRSRTRRKAKKVSPFFVLYSSLTLFLLITYNNCGQKAIQFEQLVDESAAFSSSAGAILIENDKPYTSVTQVQLTLNSDRPDEVIEMYITNDSTCESGGEWESFAETKIWELDQENEKAEVFAKFRDIDSSETECMSDDIVHDSLAPSIEWASTPDAQTAQTTAAFSMHADDALSGIASIECSLNGAAFVSCDQTVNYAGIAEGSSSFFARAKDRAGNVSDPELYEWIVDLTPPTVQFNMTPQAVSGSMTADFAFSGADTHSSVAGYYCKFDNGSLTLCNGGTYQATGLSEGPHTMTVWSIDAVGHKSDPATYNFTTDFTAPTITIVTGPQPYSGTTTATFTFNGTDNGVPITDFECQIDNGGYAACTSPQTYNNLINGPHQFDVRGKDSVGNLSDPASYAWQIDTVNPSVTLVSTPPPFTNTKSATFTFTAADNNGGVGIKETTCYLDGNASACTTTKSYNNLAVGAHTFGVRTEDLAGNMSTLVEYTWTIDQTLPVVDTLTGPDPYTSDTTATFTFSASDGSGILGYECRLDGGAYAPCTSPKTITDVSEGSHIYYVRAIDNAGNASDPRTHSWYIDLTAPTVNYVQRPIDHDVRQPATFEIAISDLNSGVQSVSCGLEGALQTCSTNYTVTYENLALGPNKFVVIATDNVGNQVTDEYTWNVSDNYELINQSVTVVDVKEKIDILFVVDNSGSMAQEQANMAERVGTFISKLNGLDWRIAVTSTDYRSNATIGDGKFAAFPDGSYYIDESFGANAQPYLSDTVEMSTNGSGSEQGIRTTYRAIERAVSANPGNNANFFRNDAAFAVVLLSDEDESGNQSYNQPMNLINLVQATWPGKQFIFHSIITIPNDQACLSGSGAKYGYRYNEASVLTGGIIGSICEQDYGNILADMGDSIQELVNSVMTTCLPVDLDNNGMPVTVTLEGGATPPPFTVNGMTVSFSSPLPAGTHNLQYYCLKPMP